jgi:SlyX protein
MTIYQQQQLIERLVEEIKTLRQQVPDGGSGSVRNLRDELPPHY